MGFCLVFMCYGIYISMRIFNIPDITTDGSYTLGAVISALLLTSGFNPYLSLLFSFFAGFISGQFTGFIHTKLKVEPLLSGILVMTALYSINLVLMGKTNIAISNSNNIISIFTFQNTITEFVFFGVFAIVILFLLRWFISTDYGLTMQATGNSIQMMKSLGVDTDKVKIMGLAIANGLTAVSGNLMTQYQSFADINMGIGIVILGLGSVIIGESLSYVFKVRSLIGKLVLILTGTLLFRLILAFVLDMGVDPSLMKAITAILVLLVVAIPQLKVFRKA